jgi:hypothetical protein
MKTGTDILEQGPDPGPASAGTGKQSLVLRRALQLVLGIDVALGLLWTLAASTARGAGGLGAVYVFLLVYALFGVSFLFALWAYWKHTEQRRLAGWIMVLPVVFGFLPVVMRSLADGAVTSDQLWIIAAVALAMAALAAWFAPRKVAVVIPAFLVRSRLFNWLLLIALVAAWLFFVLVVLYVVGEDRSSTTTSGTALAYAIVLASLYLMGLGAGSLGVSTWAWVSLRGGFESTARRLNIAQLCVAAPGILIGILITVWAMSQGQ